jgi:outer membrane protein OmpA-like peptidoglycan-associated protein
MKLHFAEPQIVDENPFALSIGDLMAALMLIFVLLLGATLLRLEESHKVEIARADTIQDITRGYDAVQKKLHEALDKEFKDDLPNWSAVLEPDLTIRFKSPEVLFEQGRSEVKDKFSQILKSFFPRYIKILQQPEFKSNITEIRIEGHTSTEWDGSTDANTAYFHNMELSQDRSRSVLKYSLSLIREPEIREWARKYITANGLSSSKPLGTPEASRRVEFRVRTNAEERIREILDKSAGQD